MVTTGTAMYLQGNAGFATGVFRIWRSRRPCHRHEGLQAILPWLKANTASRLVIEVLGRPDLASGEFADRRSRTANKEKLRAILTGIFVQDIRENWVTKMKSANIPVGYLRTVEEAFNSPEPPKLMLMMSTIRPA